MKNLVFGIIALGLTSLGFSQNPDNEMDEIQLEDVVVTSVNLNYLEEVKEIGISENVTSLENEASVFDVKSLDDFDGRDAPYKVKFIGTKGYIIADYNKNGKIIKTSERFSNIALPKSLIKSIVSQYPESQFLKVVYTVEYDILKDAEKTYKVKIMDNGKKRNLKINSGKDFNTVVTMN